MLLTEEQEKFSFRSVTWTLIIKIIMRRRKWGGGGGRMDLFSASKDFH